MLADGCVADDLQPLKNVRGWSFFSVVGILDRHPDFLSCQIVWLLCYVIFWFGLRSVDDTRVYTFIYKCVRTGVICWAGIGSECNVVHHLPTIFFFLFLQLNGSVNGLNLEYLALHLNRDMFLTLRSFRKQFQSTTYPVNTGKLRRLSTYHCKLFLF